MRGSRFRLSTLFSRPALLVSCALFAMLLPTLAHAEKPKRGAPADAAKKDFRATYFQGRRVQVDGAFLDWADAETVAFDTLTAGEYEYDWTGAADLSAEVRVQHNDDTFFVYIKVRDNALTAPKKRWKGDEIDLFFDVGALAKGKDRIRHLVIDPSYLLDNNDKPDAFWGAPRSMRDQSIDNIQLAGYAEKGGYEVEAAIPFAEFSPAPPVFSPMGFCVVVRDWDQDDKNEEEAAVASCPLVSKKSGRWRTEDLGKVHWTTRDRVWRGIVEEYPDLAEAKTLTAYGDVGGDRRGDEVVVADGKLFVMGLGLGPGEWYAYDLGLAPGDAVTALRLENVDKSRDAEIVLTMTRPYSAGEVKVEQELVAIHDFDPELGITDPLVTIEVANRLVGGDAAVTNELRFKKNKIVQRSEKAKVWTKDDYPDPDGGFTEGYAPLLLPWSKPRSRTFTRGKDGVFEWK